MTKFTHQPRSGRRKAPKEREHMPLGIRDLDALVAHRELEYLRNPTKERAMKLNEAKRRRAAGLR